MPIEAMNGVKKDGLQKYHVRINYYDNSAKKRRLTRVVFGWENAKKLEDKLQKQYGGKNADVPSIAPIDQKLTVEQLFEKYIIAKSREQREVTQDKIKRNYRLFLEEPLGKVQITKLNSQILQSWKEEIEKRDYVLGTRQNAYSLLRAILIFAVNLEYLEKNPLAKIGNFKDANTFTLKKEMDFYTPDEFKRYIGIAKNYAETREKESDLSGWDFYTFFNIAFYTGLRKGESYALKWSDIYDDYLSVTRSISQKLKGDDRETPPKNKSSIRVLQLPIPLIKILTEHRKRQEQYLPRFSTDYRICGGYNCVRDTTVYKRNILFAKMAELKAIRVHDFRHSHVSVLANEGVNIQEIARRLGHAKIEETLNTYSHMYPREEERAIDILNTIV
jgi:integrase